jgi:hypothetical protein
MILSNIELTRMTSGTNFKENISLVVTKWLNTQFKYTKACTGVYIHNVRARQCFDLLIKHIPKPVAAFHLFT